MPDIEEPLEGGNSNAGVVRIGDTVRRTTSQSTPAVHSLLAHLAESSYPAPIPMGIDDQDREILSFVPGASVDPNNLSLITNEEGLRRAGRLIADYHRAQAGFVPPADVVWRDEGRDPTGSTEVIAHNDLAPWNLIAGPTGWVFIDWDLVAPGRRSWDLAWALHSFVGLWPESTLDDATTVRHIEAFCEGAEVVAHDRSALLDVVVERTRDHAQLLRRRAATGDAPFLQLVADGHADAWEGGAHHVESTKERWSSLLTT